LLAGHCPDGPGGGFTLRQLDPSSVGRTWQGRVCSDHASTRWYLPPRIRLALASFKGLDISKPGKQDAKFTITRDAGRFDCQGYLENGEGAGVFHFTPDPNYAQQMKSLGFPVDEDKQYSMAVLDVSLDFVRKIKSENLQDLDTDKLIAFRIHGVSPEFVENLKGLGYENPTPDQLVAMRLHGVTPEYISGLKSCGMKDLTIDQLVSMRIHGIN
jgi:hypothetical protein